MECNVMTTAQDIARDVVQGVARESYRAISLYAPNRTPAAIDLSDNTNLWGVPPAAADAIRAVAAASVTRYPALYVIEVKRAIAEYLGVTPDMIVTGCGSDDVLDSAIRAFGNPGDVVAHPEPSFAMIPIFARMNGLEPVSVPLTKTFDVDAHATIATRAKVTYLCSPNNPTGASLSRGAVEAIVDESPGVVIIDEAYAEFSTSHYLDLLRRSPRVLITRTMSKAFGLAGLRIGYAIGDPALVAEVEKSRGPYKVNGIAERAAVLALTADRDWVAARVAEAVANRERLREALSALGLTPLPSAANFVLVPVRDAVAIDRAMRERGVAVRPFTALPGIGDALRISVGPWPLVETCVRVLGEVLAQRADTQEEPARTTQGAGA
jgi:histidinol-phosphate aminotransferase